MAHAIEKLGDTAGVSLLGTIDRLLQQRSAAKVACRAESSVFC
jgi:hypothetical protein